MEEADGSSMIDGDGYSCIGGGSCVAGGGCMDGMECSAADAAIISFMMRDWPIFYHALASSSKVEVSAVKIFTFSFILVTMA
jgi:hypothetical protein